MMSEVIKFLDHVRGAWRFRWWALGAAWLVCLGGWVFVMSLPNVYEASARVYLDSQSILRPLLKGLAIDPDVESDLVMVREAMLSRPHLEKIARDTDLSLRATTPEQEEALINSLRKRISIEAATRTSNTDGVYRISFQDKSRAKSLQVVRLVLDTFVDDTLGNKRTGQEDAQRFLKAQLADYSKKLSDAEERLSDFKRHNVGKMPGDQGDYFHRLQTEMTELEDVKRTLALTVARREEMAKQLTGEEPYVFGFGTPQINASQANAGGGDLTAQIQKLEARLEDLRLRFTDKHPDVIAVENTIAQLKKQQAAELARLESGQKPTGSLSQSVKTNPIYESIEVEMKQTDVQIAGLKRDVAQREARVAQLQNLVNTVPEVEAELARLNRDYEINRAEYQQLEQRLDQAKLSAQADSTGVVKFRVIDPPVVGLQPVAPNRALLLTGVLGIGIAGGAALAYLLNLLQPVFENVRTIADVTGLPVLGAVSRTLPEAEQAQHRRQLWALSGSFALLVGVFLAVLALHGLGFGLVGG